MNTGRRDDCNCGDCKKRKGITRPEPLKPARRRRRPTKHSIHRQAVLERDRYMCQICGLATDPDASPSDDTYPSLDHIIGVWVYGDDEQDNLRTAHRWCNSALTAYSPERVKELALRRFA